MSNGISLLPEDQKKKEEWEKQKVKAGMAAPKFKMHLPENGEKDESKNNPKKNFDGGDIEIGLDELTPKKGTFRLVKKNIEPVRPPLPPKPKAVPPVPPRPEARPIVAEPRGIKMRIPEIQPNLNGEGKKIVRETADKIEEIKKSLPLAEYFKKGLAVFRLKKPPAEVNLIAADYSQMVRIQLWLRIKVLLILVLIFLVIFSIGFIVCKWQKIKLMDRYNQLAGSISQTEAEINSFSTESGQAESLRDRAKVLQLLLKNHLYWTGFLDKLEHATAKNVLYTSLVAESGGGEVVLTATAKSYEDVAEQLLLFQQADFVESVEINSASQSAVQPPAGESVAPSVAEALEVKFSVQLKLKDNALLK